MNKRISSNLKHAMRSRRFVRFSRRFEEGSIRGYVLDVGPRFFLLSLVSDRLWFDGFECFRIGDVRNVRPDEDATFAEAALKKRGERLPKKPRMSVQSIEELLLSSARLFPLVAIARERVRPNACRIGKVLGVNHSRVSLLEIGPDAEWESAATELRLREITNVSFGGDYEDALHLVGGVPPKIDN
jgi:hypothetical protein